MAFLNKCDSYFRPCQHYDALKVCDLIPEEWANEKIGEDQLYIEPDLRLPLYDDTQDMLVSGLDMGFWNELNLEYFYDGTTLSKEGANKLSSESENEEDDENDEDDVVEYADDLDGTANDDDSPEESLYTVNSSQPSP